MDSWEPDYATCNILNDRFCNCENCEEHGVAMGATWDDNYCDIESCVADIVKAGLPEYKARWYVDMFIDIGAINIKEKPID